MMEGLTARDRMAGQSQAVHFGFTAAALRWGLSLPWWFWYAVDD